jgi:hypothetical protein
MDSSASLTLLEVNRVPLDALDPGAANLGRISGKKLGVPEYRLQHIRSPRERGSGRAPPDGSRRRELPDREEDPSPIAGGWKGWKQHE